MLARVPRAAWVCAIVACLNAACWSIVTPPFQTVDEPSHFAYTQQLAENTSLPASTEFGFSQAELFALFDLHQTPVQGRPAVGTISTPEELAALDRDLHRELSTHGNGGVGGAANGPPLYYLLETVPYGLASGGTVLDQLELMRLLSALMGGLTALFVFLFVREVVPAAPWAWTVGGLAAALTPQLGFISGAMNPDAMLFAVSAAIFYCLARAFRHGLTRALAITLGVLTAVGFLTKLNFVGLGPGVGLGLSVLSVRAARVYGRRTASLTLAIALAIAASPVLIYAVVNLASNHSLLGVVSSTLSAPERGKSIFKEASFIWQYYLPRLPGMTNYFPGLSMTRDLWFNKAVGVYGWLDTWFPPWVYNFAIVPVGLIAVLFIRGLFAARAALRARVAEFIVYGAVALGLLILLGASAYFDNNGESLGFAEARYLLPLLSLGAVVLTLAARGAGRRWGPPVGALLVVLFLAHDIFSQLLVAGRFYR